jgi:hypothetical protein
MGTVARVVQIGKEERVIRIMRCAVLQIRVSMLVGRQLMRGGEQNARHMERGNE